MGQITNQMAVEALYKISQKVSQKMKSRKKDGKSKDGVSYGKEAQTYDRENQKPVIRCSICTGEQVAGFKDIHTGKFEEIMLIKNDADLRSFKETYGLTEVTKEY